MPVLPCDREVLRVSSLLQEGGVGSSHRVPSLTPPLSLCLSLATPSRLGTQQGDGGTRHTWLRSGNLSQRRRERGEPSPKSYRRNRSHPAPAARNRHLTSATVIGQSGKRKKMWPSRQI